MANMGYCRFRNTLSDLRECQEHLDDPVEGDCCSLECCDCRNLSDEEHAARVAMISLCSRIAERYA